MRILVGMLFAISSSCALGGTSAHVRDVDFLMKALISDNGNFVPSDWVRSLGLDAGSKEVRQPLLGKIYYETYAGMQLQGGYKVRSVEFRKAGKHLSAIAMYFEPGPCLSFSRLAERYGPFQPEGADADAGTWIYGRQLSHGELHVHTLPPARGGDKCVVALAYTTD